MGKEKERLCVWVWMWGCVLLWNFVRYNDASNALMEAE